MDIETTRKRWGYLVLGLICLTLGAIWTSRGAGFIAGSSMTGKTIWLVIGIALGVCGLILTVGALLSQRRR